MAGRPLDQINTVRKVCSEDPTMIKKLGDVSGGKALQLPRHIESSQKTGDDTKWKPI